MLSFLRRRRASGNDLELARPRIRHVVVLMLENRSFDHLLGFLQYPGFPTLKEGAHPNPVDAGKAATEPVRVSRNAREILRLDPPHSHVSVKQQLNARGRRFGMDGFVRAYANKLRNLEHLPVFHWIRIELVALALALLVGAAVDDIFRRVDDGWGAYALWVIPPVLILVGSTWVVRGLLKTPLWLYAGLVAVVGWVIGAGISGLAHVGSTNLDRLLAIAAGLGVAVTAFVIWLRQRTRKREHIPPEQVDEECKYIMRCWDPDRIRVFAMLAEQFAVCTRWHASVPGATWPNRNFAHAATSESTVDIEVGFYDSRTVFEMLEDAAQANGTPAGEAWRIYHEGMAQTLAFPWLWSDGRAANWHTLTEFFDHVAEGALPWYSFIEPHHSKGDSSNSQHPGNNQIATGDRSDFHRGEVLVRDIYEALRNQEALFRETLLVVTYDEHGGLFDHAPPPRAKHPEALKPKFSRLRFTRRVIAWLVENKNSPFDFKRLGVRVPAILISPWIGPHKVEEQHIYDHSSIVATLHDLFAPKDRGLTARDRAANPFYSLVLERTTDREMPPAPQPAPPDPDLPPTAGAPVPSAGAAAGATQTSSEVRQKAAMDDQLDEQLGTLEEELRELTALGLGKSRTELLDQERDVVGRFVAFAQNERLRQRRSPDTPA